MRPGTTLDIDLKTVDPKAMQLIRDGDLTSVPTVPPEVIEAGISAADEDVGKPVSVERFSDFRRRVSMKLAIYAAQRATQVVFLATVAAPKATGVEVILEVRDADGNPDLTNNALEVVIAIVGLPGQVITIPAAHAVSGATSSVRFRNGRARFTVTGSEAATGTAQMSATSRGTLLTITDTETVELT